MINVIAEFKPINNGRFALMDDSVIRGGFHAVPSLFERNRIPVDRRKIGMLVSVAEDGNVYKLMSDLETWEELASGGGDYTFSTGLTVSLDGTVTVNFGTTSGTVCSGNDTRLGDSRTPLQHNLLSHIIEDGVNGQVLVVTSATTFSFVTMSGDINIDKTGLTQVVKVKGNAVEKLGIFVNDVNLGDDVEDPTLVPGMIFDKVDFMSVKIDFAMYRPGVGYSCGYIKLMYDGVNARMTYVEDDATADIGVNFTLLTTTNEIHLLYTSSSSGYDIRMKYTTVVF